MDVYKEKHAHRALNACQGLIWLLDALKNPETHKEIEEIIQSHSRPVGERIRYYFDGLTEDVAPGDLYWIAMDHIGRILEPFIVADSREQAVAIGQRLSREDREARARGHRTVSEMGPVR